MRPRSTEAGPGSRAYTLEMRYRPWGYIRVTTEYLLLSNGLSLSLSFSFIMRLPDCDT